jgi:hypothetical protein
MAKFKRVNHGSGELYGWRFTCPGCSQWDEPGSSLHGTHVVTTGWTFNGDVDKPTLSPSVLVTGKYRDEERRCHSFVHDGRIQFLSDCTHNLAGQTVELPEVE